MANINAPFGFRPIRRLDGAAWTGNHTTRRMENTSGALNRGDVVKQLATGYIGVSNAGVTDHSSLGIFVGCHYLSSALGYPIWSNYWPGSGAVGEVDAFIIDDPFVVFEVQGSGATIHVDDIGMNADFIVAASTTGFSKWTLNSGTYAPTGTFPFRLIALGSPAPNVGNGYDHTSNYNVVEVAWNDHFMTQKIGL